jgi:hypothetical protein
MQEQCQASLLTRSYGPGHGYYPTCQVLTWLMLQEQCQTSLLTRSYGPGHGCYHTCQVLTWADVAGAVPG